MFKLNIKGLIISLCASNLIIACDTNRPLQDDSSVPHKGVSASIEGYRFCGSNTKVSYLVVDNSFTPMWQLGDEIGVLPMDGKTTQSNFRVYSTQSQNYSADFDGGMWAIKDGHQYAAYYPLKNQVLTSHSRLTLSFKKQVQQDKSDPSHISQYDYMYANAETAINGAINLKFRHKISVLAIQMSLPPGNYKQIKITADENWFADEAILSLDDGTLTAVAESLSNTATLALDDISLEEESAVVFYVAVCPTKNICERSFDIVVSSSSVAKYYKITLPNSFEACTSYYCIAEPKSPIVTDLSENGTANCYIVNEYGLCKFNATMKGHTSESVGSIASAEVLWESYGNDVQPSVGDIVKNVSVQNGIVSFTASGKDGNAVIAVKDAVGDILWSWHIWVCQGFDANATAQVYYNKAGTVMDRNLGATSATKGDVRALGLLYQWGRKDPFLGGQSISYASSSNQDRAKSTISWPATVSSDANNGTTDYVIKHPTTFVTANTSNSDWYYTGNSSTDNTRWSSGKGMYDPCPKGWKVPDGDSKGLWAKALGTSSYFYGGPWDSSNLGMDFTGRLSTASEVWYPASGYLYGEDGALNNVGYGGYCWSCTTNNKHAYEFNFYYNSLVNPKFVSRYLGNSIRCVKE